MSRRHRYPGMFLAPPLSAAIILIVPLATTCSSNRPHTKDPRQLPDLIDVWRDPFFLSEPLPLADPPDPYNHAATIAELAGGDLLVAWVAGSRELGRDTRILATRLADGRSSWTAPIVLADKPDAPEANPSLFVDPDSRLRLYYVEMFGDNFCAGRVMSKSADTDAAIWSDASPALPALCTMTKNRPIATHSGRWIMPAYQEAVYQSQFWLSDDCGRSWRLAASLLNILDSNLQPAIVQLPDQSLLALMRAGGPSRCIWEARSTNNGEAWSLAPRPDLPNPNSGIDLIRLHDGSLLLLYNPSPTDRMPLAAALSTDDGRSWSSPVVIAGHDAPAAYPSAIQTRDGLIHVVFSHRLEHIHHVAFNSPWLQSRLADETP